MKYLSKLSSAFCTAALGLLVLTGCEGSDLYSVDSPDWISDKVDSIANADTGDGVTISPLVLGATDNSDAWWGSHLDADILVPSNKVYTIGFTNYSSGVNNWNNYVVVLRSADKKTEYAVLRADNYGWSGDLNTNANLDALGWNLSDGPSDWAAWLAAMDGAHVTVAVTNYGDNTADVVATVEGTDGNTYVQSYTGITVESANLYLDFTTDGSHYVFDKEEVDVADAVDQQPVSMELVDVPVEAFKGSSLEDFTADIKAQVTFDGGTVKEIAASELTFMTIPDDLNSVGEKYLVATYNKTMFGKEAASAVYASAKFNVVLLIESIAVTQAPRTHYFYTSPATAGMLVRTLTFDPTGMEVTATYTDGTTAVVNNETLTFSTMVIPAKAGVQTVTVSTANGKAAEVEVPVEESSVTAGAFNPGMVGPEDNITEWWTSFSNDVKVPAGATISATFTNYSNLVANWNNFLVILRKADLAEYAVLRADNYGWGAGFDGQPVLLSGGQADWEAWLATMNGAEVTVYVTNCNNGTADVQIIMKGTDGNTYTQYYLGVTPVDPDDLYLAFTVDGCHLVF